MDSVPVLVPQNRQPSLHAGNSEQGIAMSSLSVDQDVRNRNGSTSQESFEEGAENGFHIRKEQPNSQDPDRRAKEFKARHIQMMALGGAIGAGLLFQSGRALYQGGPVSLLLAYLLMGTVSYAVLITLGEMISFLPIPGGFFTLANRCLSPAIGFACGWSYWFAYVLGFPAKLVAAQSIMALWLPNVNPAVWISAFALIPILFNCFNVRRYGEIEYWLTVCKVVTIVGIIILGILLPMGASAGIRLLGTQNNQPVECNPSTDANCLSLPGFQYWREVSFQSFLLPGSAGRFFGFWDCCCQAIYSYVGTELIAIAADETERQRETLPKAVRRVSYRIWVYYVGAIFVLGLNVSANDPLLKNSLSDPHGSYESPFVLMVRRAGIPGLGHVINAVALIASLSVANANLYTSSRALYALAREGQAPRIFAGKNRYDVPGWSLALSALPCVLAYLSVGSIGANNVFDFLSSLTATCALFPWAVICVTFLRFRRAVKKHSMGQAIPPTAVSPLQPYLAIYGLAWSSLLCISPNSSDIVIFYGYLVFFRNNAIWTYYSDTWKFTVAPWVMIGAIVILVFSWIAKNFVMERVWTWSMPRLDQVDLYNGVAPLVEPDTPPKNKFMRALLWVLKTI